MTPAEFLDYLGRAISEIANAPDPPADWLRFRRQCEAREEAGRAEFGDEYLRRDNASEGLEEAADGALYCYFEAERVKESGGDYEAALQLAVIAAQHFFRAHEALQEMHQPTS